MTMTFNGRLGLVQRVLAAYRVPFFEMLSENYPGGFSLFAGHARNSEHIAEAETAHTLDVFPAKNIHIGSGHFYSCWQLGLLRWLEEWQPKALIVEANPRYLSTSSAIRWMHQRDLPVIGWGLGLRQHQGTLAKLTQPARQRFIQSFDALITYSQAGADEYIKSGAKPDSIFVAVNAVSPRPTRPMPERPDTILGQPKVLFVGRLQARKRIENLLTACQQLPPHLQPALTIVGDGPVREDLEQLARSIFPQTVFSGARFGDELDQLFDQADLFVLPGTGGLAIQQAMSHALPIIAAEADGTQAQLVTPANGWQIAANNIDELTNTLRSALSDVPRLRQMGRESYRIVMEEINLETMVEVFMDAIDYARERRA